MEQLIKIFSLPDEETRSFFFVHSLTDTDSEVQLHKHDLWELYYVVKGRGTHIIGDTASLFASGDVVLIPPAMPHHWQYDHAQSDNIECIMLAFNDELIVKCESGFPEFRAAMIRADRPKSALKFDDANGAKIKALLNSMVGGSDLMQLSVLLQLLPLLFSSSAHITVGEMNRTDRNDNRMRLVNLYLITHFNTQITLDDIAKELTMNRTSFCSFFLRCKGMTFFQYLSQFRIDMACDMLIKTSFRMAQICFAVGFRDIPHFNRTFKKIVGVSPSAYRIAHQVQNNLNG